MAALTTQSQLTATTTAETQASVAAAINQLAANQQAMQQQFAAFATQKIPRTKQGHQHPPSRNLPSPTWQLSLSKDTEAVDVPGDVDVADVQTLRPKENAMYARCLPALPLVKADCLQLVQVEDVVVAWPHLHNKPQHTTRPPCTQTYSRPMQIGTYVFLCGFDVEDGHTSKTCPAQWRQANHQEGFDQTHASQYLSTGCDACTKAMHKSQLPC